jgi:CRP-like cAMP-binding protein
MGEMALFFESILEGDIVAVEETEACVLPKQAVQEVLRNRSSLRLLEEMAKRLSAAEQLIADLDSATWNRGSPRSSSGLLRRVPWMSEASQSRALCRGPGLPSNWAQLPRH